MYKENKKLYNKLYSNYLITLFLEKEEHTKKLKNALDVLTEHYKEKIKNYSIKELHDIGFDVNTGNEIIHYFETNELNTLNTSIYSIEHWIVEIITSRAFIIQDLIKIFKQEKDIYNISDLFKYCSSYSFKSHYGEEKQYQYCRYLNFMLNEDFPFEIRNNNSIIKNNIDKIQNSNIYGGFHNHTKYSDGINTIQEMKDVFVSLGMNYIGISDHSKYLSYSGGLNESDVLIQHKEIDRLNEFDKTFRIFKGIECEILEDGNLDYTPDFLYNFDYVIISAHNTLNQSEAEANKRMIKAIENPYTTILGHPTSRCYKRNPGLNIDIYKIMDACIANNVIIEINGDPDKLDLDEKYLKYAEKKGALFSLESDSHSIHDVKNINYSLYMANQAGLSANNCINTFTEDSINKLFKSKKACI